MPHYLKADKKHKVHVNTANLHLQTAEIRTLPQNSYPCGTWPHKNHMPPATASIKRYDRFPRGKKNESPKNVCTVRRTDLRRMQPDSPGGIRTSLSICPPWWSDKGPLKDIFQSSKPRHPIIRAVHTENQRIASTSQDRDLTRKCAQTY